jgi:hypothetical protein
VFRFGLEVIFCFIDILGSDMMFLLPSLIVEEFVGGFPRAS